jgi:hypothetical protein
VRAPFACAPVGSVTSSITVSKLPSCGANVARVGLRARVGRKSAAGTVRTLVVKGVRGSPVAVVRTGDAGPLLNAVPVRVGESGAMGGKEPVWVGESGRYGRFACRRSRVPKFLRWQFLLWEGEDESCITG